MLTLDPFVLARLLRYPQQYKRSRDLSRVSSNWHGLFSCASIQADDTHIHHLIKACGHLVRERNEQEAAAVLSSPKQRLAAMDL